jgi:hypothetical protein
MPKKTRVIIHLPNPKPTVELSPTLADSLRQIIASGAAGVSSLELLEAGLISAHNNVSKLRKYGAIIHSERRFVPNWRGKDRHGIAHYIYKGWIDHRIVERDKEV